MAEWLSSSRKKKIGDIRSFIPVRGKILKPKSTSLNLESSSGVDCLVSDPHEAWPRTSRGKQLSLAQISKQDAAAKCTCQKVPASLVTTGIRRKTARTAATNEKQDPAVFTGHGMEDKENFDTETSQVTTHTSLSACHRESYAQLKQQRSPTKKSTAILGKHKLSDFEQCWISYSNQRHCDKLDECLTRGPRTSEGDGSCLGSSVGTSPQQCTRQAAQASESTPNHSPPAKRLRPEHDYSSDRDCCRRVKIRCSQGRNLVRTSTDWNKRLGSHLADNEVNNILQNHKQAHGTKVEVQTVGTTTGSSTVPSAESDTVTKHESAGVSTSALPVSNSPLGYIAHVDTSDGTTADVADTHLVPTRIEECSFLEPVPNSQGLFSFSTSSNVDTDELLAELSDCEKMV